MKTDSLFYRLLQAEPTLAFDLAGLDVPERRGYSFISQEVKQTAFRVDGIAEPPAGQPNAPRGYVEVQFQPDEDFYPRFFREILWKPSWSINYPHSPAMRFKRCLA